jgi:hypothetical protein
MMEFGEGIQNCASSLLFIPSKLRMLNAYLMRLAGTLAVSQMLCLSSFTHLLFISYLYCLIMNLSLFLSNELCCIYHAQEVISF